MNCIHYLLMQLLKDLKTDFFTILMMFLWQHLYNNRCLSAYCIFHSTFFEGKLNVRIKAQCALILFLDYNPPCACILDTVWLLFLEKNPLCAIIRSHAFINFELFFSIFFWTFPPILSKFFSSFNANFIHLPWKSPCLLNFG